MCVSEAVHLLLMIHVSVRRGVLFMLLVLHRRKCGHLLLLLLLLVVIHMAVGPIIVGRWPFLRCISAQLIVGVVDVVHRHHIQIIIVVVRLWLSYDQRGLELVRLLRRDRFARGGNVGQVAASTDVLWRLSTAALLPRCVACTYTCTMTPSRGAGRWQARIALDGRPLVH